MERAKKLTFSWSDDTLFVRPLMRTARVLIIASSVMPEIANALCTSLIQGPVAVDVQSCGVVNPEAFDPSRPKFKVVGDLDPEGKKLLLDQYRGLAVKGMIVRSQAVHVGLDTQKGALQGQSIMMFLPPAVGAQCAEIAGKRILGQLQEKCCDGNSEAPCLLDTGMTLSNIKVSGPSATDSEGKTTSARPSKEHTKEYTQAEKYYAQKKFKNAVDAFKNADSQDDMDLKGLVRWGFAYRNLEDCPNAVKPLKRVYEMIQKGKVWSEDELEARKGLFLLARCHAKMGDPSTAVFYLNGFLIEPKKYRSELQQALKHKDFGWIHTSKEYREFRADAQKKLGQR